MIPTFNLQNVMDSMGATAMEPNFMGSPLMPVTEQAPPIAPPAPNQGVSLPVMEALKAALAKIIKPRMLESAGNALRAGVPPLGLFLPPGQGTSATTELLGNTQFAQDYKNLIENMPPIIREPEQVQSRIQQGIADSIKNLYKYFTAPVSAPTPSVTPPYPRDPFATEPGQPPTPPTKGRRPQEGPPPPTVGAPMWSSGYARDPFATEPGQPPTEGEIIVPSQPIPQVPRPDWESLAEGMPSRKLDVAQEMQNLFEQNMPRWEDLPQRPPEDKSYGGYLKKLAENFVVSMGGYDPYKWRQIQKAEKEEEFGKQREYFVQQSKAKLNMGIEVLKQKYQQETDAINNSINWANAQLTQNPDIVKDASFWARLGAAYGVPPETIKAQFDKYYDTTTGKLTIPTPFERQLNQRQQEAEQTLEQEIKVYKSVYPDLSRSDIIRLKLAGGDIKKATESALTNAIMAGNNAEVARLKTTYLKIKELDAYDPKVERMLHFLANPKLLSQFGLSSDGIQRLRGLMTSYVLMGKEHDIEKNEFSQRDQSAIKQIQNRALAIFSMPPGPERDAAEAGFKKHFNGVTINDIMALGETAFQSAGIPTSTPFGAFIAKYPKALTEILKDQTLWKDLGVQEFMQVARDTRYKHEIAYVTGKLGRTLTETERVAIAQYSDEARAFNRDVDPEFLDAVSEKIRNAKSGQIRVYGNPIGVK